MSCRHLVSLGVSREIEAVYLNPNPVRSWVALAANPEKKSRPNSTTPPSHLSVQHLLPTLAAAQLSFLLRRQRPKAKTQAWRALPPVRVRNLPPPFSCPTPLTRTTRGPIP